MVIAYIAIVLFCLALHTSFLASPLAAFQEAAVNLPAKVTVQISQAYANQPIQGTISIIRVSKQKVDETSFTLDDAKLSVVHSNDEWPQGKGGNDALVVSTYTFSLPPKGQGLYFLSPIFVRVGDMMASSTSISYQVISPVQSGDFGLQARLVTKEPIYPGQPVAFEYRIFYRNPIQLTKEELPILSLDGFRTVGAPEVTSAANGDASVQVITQKAIALRPGTFQSGSSLIEGYVYSQNSSGQNVFRPPLLRAEAPGIVVHVSPFPANGRPVSFNGAIGVFRWQVQLIGSSSVALGEKLRLQVFVSGQGDINTVQLPDLSLQSGLKDRFLLGDIPPLGEEKDGTKSFVLELRPIQKDIREIPPIEFSSFDPSTGTYMVIKSAPIPVAILAGSDKSVVAKPVSPAIGPIEIQGNVLIKDDELRTRHLDALLLVYTALFLFAGFCIECLLARLMKESKEKVLVSRDLLLKAIKAKNNPDESARLIRSALLLALFEVGYTKTVATLPEELSSEGVQGEIKALLSSLEKKRFMGLETQVEMNEIISEATQLYTRIKK